MPSTDEHGSVGTETLAGWTYDFIGAASGSSGCTDHHVETHIAEDDCSGTARPDEGAWSVVGGRTLTLRPFSASDMVAKEREQLELRATDERWRHMPPHGRSGCCGAALKHQPTLTIDEVGDLMEHDDHGADWYIETIGRCLGSDDGAGRRSPRSWRPRRRRRSVAGGADGLDGDYIMDMPLHQLHAVCEHLARIDRRREKANG